MNDYRVVKDGYNRWTIEIHRVDNGALVFDFDLYISPNTAIDYQAMAETDSTGVKIDGTHYRKLKYYYSGSTWIYWDTHEADPFTEPYHINEISHHEFKAYGGG